MPQEKKKYLLMSKTKSKKNYIKNVTHQVSLSKLGLSFEKSCDSFFNNQLKFTKKLDTIKNDLDQVILKIKSQQKRHQLLKKLVTLMKAESSKLENQHKQSDLILKQSYTKYVKKLQYDISQIQQKCNQEVANITILNQQVNVKRSERVVFSNLFKKMQAELKITSEKYKQELVKSEIKKKFYKNNSLCIRIYKKQIIPKKNNRQTPSKRVSTLSALPVDKKTIFQKCSPSQRQIFQNYKQKIGLKNIKKKLKQSRYITEANFQSADEFQEEQDKTQQNNREIQAFKAEIQKIKAHFGEDTYRSIFNFGVNAKHENQGLQQKIQSLERQIYTIQCQQKQILKMRKNNEVTQNLKLPYHRRGRTRDKTQLNIQAPQQASICQKTNEQYVLQISEMFISCPNLRSNQTFLQIDKVIDSIIQIQNIKVINQRLQMRKTDSSSSKTLRQNGPEEILGRMKPLTQFQKLLDQQSFFYQYKKQINRFNNTGSSKK